MHRCQISDNFVPVSWATEELRIPTVIVVRVDTTADK